MVLSQFLVFWLLHNVYMYHDNFCQTYLAAKTRVIYMSDHFPTRVPGHANSCDKLHNSDVIMSEMASQITSLTTGYSGAYSGADHRKQQSPVSLAFVRGFHRWSVYSPHKGPVMRRMFPFDDVIMSRQKTVFLIHSNPISRWHWLSMFAEIRTIRWQYIFSRNLQLQYCHTFPVSFNRTTDNLKRNLMQWWAKSYYSNLV